VSKEHADLIYELTKIDRFVEALRTRLHEKAKEGFVGWDETTDRPKVSWGDSVMLDHVHASLSKGEYLDAASIASILWWRQVMKRYSGEE